MSCASYWLHWSQNTHKKNWNKLEKFSKQVQVSESIEIEDWPSNYLTTQVKKCVESWTGHDDYMMKSWPRHQCEWEAEIVEHINYISDKTWVWSAKAPSFYATILPLCSLEKSILACSQPGILISEATLDHSPVLLFRTHTLSTMQLYRQCPVRWVGWH